MILALADGKTTAGGDAEDALLALQALLESFQSSKLLQGKALLRQLVVFDAEGIYNDIQDVMRVPATLPQLPALRNLMCDITALLLVGFEDLLRSLQDLPAIESPFIGSPNRSSAHYGDLANRVRQRMSMPVSSGPSTPIGDRSTTNTSSMPSDGTAKDMRKPAPRPPALDLRSESSSRDRSQDRFSVAGSPNAVPPSPRLAVSKGRLRIVTGALCIEAGLWPDALKSLSEGVAAARANSDYIWHARGLECLLICMLMLVWAELPFEIPNVCLPSSEKYQNAGATFYRPTPENTSNAGAAASQPPSSLHPVSLIPDVLGTVSTLYSRASNFTNDDLPEILLCESKLRAVGLLSAFHLRMGNLNRQALSCLVSGHEISPALAPERSLRARGFQKDELAEMLLDTLPGEGTTQLAPSDCIRVLLGISSQLSQLSLDRKQAFVLKDVLSMLAPLLVEARKLGAAEMGVHPSASLIASPGLSKGSDVDRSGITRMLGTVGKMYDMPYAVAPGSQRQSNTIQEIADRTRNWEASRHYGGTTLKMEILRSCVSICEALPDLDGILVFVGQLLQTARNVVTLPPTTDSGPPLIAQDEQCRLFNIIKRTVTVAARLGQEAVLAEYWDDFLVRAIVPLEPSESTRLMVHSSRELIVTATTPGEVKKDPFIYSSFTKAATKTDDRAIVPMGETCHFEAILQNPFEIDVEIDEISLLCEGCDFEPTVHSVVLGPFCSQPFILSGTPGKSGTLKIIGCKAKVRYCHQRTFHVLSRPWASKQADKVTGSKLKPSSTPSGNEKAGKEPSHNHETGDIITLGVLEAQPSLSIISSSLAQPALMLLEGETRSFQLTVHNCSPTIPADLILFTYQDSATTQLQEALSGRELAPAELHELQFQLAGKPSLRWVPANDHGQTPSLPANSSASFTFEAFGKPGLLTGTVQIDYAHLGVPSAEVKDKFYTRQLRYPVSLTVNGAIDIPRINILPFSGDFAWANQQRSDGAVTVANGSPDSVSSKGRSRAPSRFQGQKDGDQFAALLSRLGTGAHGDDHCLFLLDLRNVWPHPLTVSIQVREATSSSSDSWRRAYTVHEVLQPGHLSRVLLLLPRIYVADPHASIPLIGNQRQFVVSTSKLTAEAEEASRELFWHREELLKYIRGSWREDSTGREGEIDMRKGIRLSPRMIAALRLDDIEIDFGIRPSKIDQDARVTQLGKSRFRIQAKKFNVLVIKIRNRSAEPVHSLLRLQPSLRHQPHNIALDLSKRFAWTGMLQRALHPPLEPGEVREAELGVMALCEGDFEIGATVEEIRASRKFQISEASNASPKRRIWHAREPCFIDAVEAIEDAYLSASVI